MTKLGVNEIKSAISDCSDEEKQVLRKFVQRASPHELERKWGVSADVILDAIEKSSDLTKRGFRGILAESIFESDVIPDLSGGWHAVAIDRNKDLPYDSLLKHGEQEVKVQVKLQRSEKGKPMLFHPKHYDEELYVVEVQKTRTGSTSINESLPDSSQKVKVSKKITKDTRPYEFGQFDIIAVSMHPSTNEWKSFKYTLGNWLLARPGEPTKIAILQPVAKESNEVWTHDLATCLQWLKEGEQKKVLVEVKHLRSPKPKKIKPKVKRKPKQKTLKLDG